MSRDNETSGLNRTLLGKLIVIAVVMFGFAYALNPFYRQICEALGLNVLTQKDGTVEFDKNTQVDKTRNVVIEFDANAQGPYRFRPTVTYEVVNTQNRDVAAQAIPSYAPQNAMQHFKKVECFCFKQQALKPNEARQMPVVFFIDPALPKDVKTITLSYTFFEVGGMDKTAGKTAAVSEGAKNAVR